MRKIYSIIAFLILGSLSASAAPPFDNPHEEANRCRLGFKSDCDSACIVCHMAPGDSAGFYPTPWPGPEIKAGEAPPVPPISGAAPPSGPDLSGDILLCLSCHEELRYKGGGHPVGVPYDADDIRKELIRDPRGPKLFCAQRGGGCRVLCSTCHDPHGNNKGLLRLKGRRKAFCISCHRK